jgi:hypothetical protein
VNRRPIPTLGVSAVLLAAAVLIACGTVTKIPNAWRNPAHEGAPYQKIFVIGVGENDASRPLLGRRTAFDRGHGDLGHIGQHFVVVA